QTASLVITPMVSAMLAASLTLKPENGNDLPVAVVTVTVGETKPTVDAMVMEIGRFASVPPLVIVAVMPGSLNVTAVAPDRLAPLIVLATLEPGMAMPGVMAVIVGSNP